jgi:hypothetical protein
MQNRLGVFGAALLIMSALVATQGFAGVQKVVVGEEYGATW